MGIRSWKPDGLREAKNRCPTKVWLECTAYLSKTEKGPNVSKDVGAKEVCAIAQERNKFMENCKGTNTAFILN